MSSALGEFPTSEDVWHKFMLFWVAKTSLHVYCFSVDSLKVAHDAGPQEAGKSVAAAKNYPSANVIRLMDRRRKVRRNRLEIDRTLVNKTRMLGLTAFLSLAACILAPEASTAVEASGAGVQQRVVFANYRPDFGAYGNNVAGYKREIQQAQAVGVDGFALDKEGWGPDTAGWANFQQLAGYMFQAAAELGTGFKLFFDLDCQGYGYDNACIAAAGQMLAAYGNNPNYFHYQGRPLFTGWSSGLDTTKGSTDDQFWSAVAASIKSTGLSPFFMPTFSNWTAANPISSAQSYANTEAWLTSGWLNSVVQGLITWGDYVPPLYVENNDAFAAVAAHNNIAFAASVESWHAPIRFLSTGQAVSGDIMASLEFNGGEGLSAIWEYIITKIKPSMVYLVTWNDYTESYMGPASQVDLTADNQPAWQVTGDYLFTHAAYTDLNRYFIQWYKTGVQPTRPDAMYVSYRNASTKMVASRAPAGTVISWNQEGLNPTLDDIYITTILAAPATMTVTSGGRVTSVSLGTGLNHTRVPFNVGAQKFVLIRNQTTLVGITGANVVSSEPYYYNVNPVSYYGYYEP